MGNCHARFGAGENLEITSKGYLSLKASTLWQPAAGVAHIVLDGCGSYGKQKAGFVQQKYVRCAQPLNGTVGQRIPSPVSFRQAAGDHQERL